MQAEEATGSHAIVKLDNYRFSGLDSSLVGAIKSVTDYYGLPLTASWIYGMTGLAFLFVLDENMTEPNGGPPVPKVLRLARNIGVDIEGFHVYADGEEFTRLQQEAWDKAREAIAAGQPVFAKNIDIRNQFSVVYGYDDNGYYRYNWHTGYELSEDVIPWNLLGLSRCTCIHCVNNRERAEAGGDITGGLVSLHCGRAVEAEDDHASFKQALEFVIAINEQGTYQCEWSGKTYLVGERAYERWLEGLADGSLSQYFFSLFIEILNESRSHAVQFLTEVRERLAESNQALIDELTRTYNEISAKFSILRDTYPYTEPPEHEVKESEWCALTLSEIQTLEKQALGKIKEIYAAL
ncbi:hypothetical protein A8990_11674 [Paenibacillus taihuensis]|uniref:Uncharacterized protein n=1 Tax=Paenibacillus taihuensis TaxID=1156355 RepID=A0A3D9S4W8_9BACL|nr:hypothetical protein [Paenibacillus taihuensis]REE83895.1 hypothetical protein A8990_11674 [Paenibacillus taihuensis]